MQSNQSATISRPLNLEQPCRKPGPAAFRSLTIPWQLLNILPRPRSVAALQPLRAGQGTSFLWRKLHSLLGIIPIGAFLLEHLLSNFEALKGPLAYGEQVKFLNSLPLVRVLEWVFIFLPILYHALYGV